MFCKLAKLFLTRQTTRILQPDQSVDADTTLTISYASASGYPLSPPFAIAKGFGWPAWGFGIEGVNSRLEGWLARQLSEGRKVKGIVPLDFYRQDGLGREDGGVMELLVLMNTL
jgi:1-phosphatidylinositol phosphodiesterase